MRHCGLSILLAFALLPFPKALAEPGSIAWQPWSDAVFARAKSEGRFVLLDLGTVWCHWCHVMEEVTYQDRTVIELIRKRYVAVRVDADARPDLANRYEDYGWPATVIFNADGGEIVKRRGYLPPLPMASMLQAVIHDPTPGPSVVTETPLVAGHANALGSDSRSKLRQLLIDRYDNTNRGWGTAQKFLDWDTIEYCMSEAARGDQVFGRMARETLAAQLNLMDPAWGGVYQYSTDGDWQHPHFEKIMQMQAEDLRTYAQAYAFWHDDTYLQAASRIRGYLKNFLTSPGGAFYTSQDADLVPGEHGGEYFQLSDADRRKRGVPRIDVHIYSRENGWAINALTTLYAVSGERDCLDDAIRAANWVCAYRAVPGGGFRHDEADAEGPYLGDTLSMGRAFLTLYECTADRGWLQRAERAVKFISANFASNLGYITCAHKGALTSKPQLDENVGIVRLANLLWHYTGNSEYRDMAARAMSFLAAPGVTDHRGFLVAGVLLADREITSTPLHITVVSRKDDATGQMLFAAAVLDPATYKRVEWLDEREGPLPNPDIEYPTLSRAAAFLCTDNACSAPIFTADDLIAKTNKH
ncbi:MAG: thioredoxin domain-containing protein [Verrucomicrobia bacterium]|nr:thioredoxin domain-containing protein [Verrucomicrobiota bacterium]